MWENEYCPVFIQYLDCIYQLMINNNEKFEFNHKLLDKLAIELYSEEFNTFKYNSNKERNINKESFSIFEFILNDRDTYRNEFYLSTNDDLIFHSDICRIEIWESFYLRYNFDWIYINSYKLSFNNNKLDSDDDKVTYFNNKHNDENQDKDISKNVINNSTILQEKIKLSMNRIEDSLCSISSLVDEDNLEKSMVYDSYSFIN